MTDDQEFFKKISTTLGIHKQEINFNESDIEYRYNKVKEIIQICKNYSDSFGYTKEEVFEALEKKRTYSYENYYQYANFPELKHVTVFDNIDHAREVVQPEKGFRCPNCQGISTDPYKCNSGIKLVLINSDGKKEPCNWKSFGLFGCLGKEFTFTIKEGWLEKPQFDNMFMPISMEENHQE